MFVVPGNLIPEQGLVSLQIIKTIVLLATPELGLVQVRVLIIPVRVETWQKKAVTMDKNTLKPWATFLSTK